MQANGKTWYDTNGNAIQAHGGWMLQANGWYYWYGENRLGNRYVSCYRSKDLEAWEFRNDILTADSPAEETRVVSELKLKRENGKVNIERPKVLYCKKTGKYVLWAHYENGENYLDARICIATCDTPDGDFVYHGSFNPYGYMSRDCTLFQDDDGRCYFLSAARDNADMHVYLLTDDLLNVKKHINTLWQGEYREAPAVFKKDGRYYILSSHCTGWRPNQGGWSMGDSLYGEFTEIENFGDHTTFDSQPAFVLPLQQNGKTEYIYWGDRWCFQSVDVNTVDRMMDFYPHSTYVLLPIRFNSKAEPFIEWAEQYPR